MWNFERVLDAITNAGIYIIGEAKPYNYILQ